MFWQISVNISKTMQDRDIGYLQWKTNRKPYIAYQMAATAVTLNDREGHAQVVGLFKCNPPKICYVLAELLNRETMRIVYARNTKSG